MEGGEVKDSAHLGRTIALREHMQVLFRAIVLAGETKQLEQERTAPGIGRVVPNLSPQRLYCLIQLTGLKQLLGRHCRFSLRRDVRLEVVLEVESSVQRTIRLLRLVAPL